MKIIGDTRFVISNLPKEFLIWGSVYFNAVIIIVVPMNKIITSCFFGFKYLQI